MDSNIHENRSSSDEAFFTKQLANNLECVFWIAPPDLSKMLYISKGYEQIWGKTCESLYKKPKSFLDNVHKEDIKVVREHLKEMHHKGTFDHKYRIVKQTGEVRWVWDRGFPLKNEDGKIYLQDEEVDLNQMVARITVIFENRKEDRIYVHGDQRVNYGRVMEVIGLLNGNGFSRVAMVTDPSR